MVEVEVKFKLTEAEQQKLIENAQFIEEYEFTDVYYDTSDYALSTNDIWLRTRNGKYILKMPLPTTSHILKEQKNSPKKEIEDLNEIATALKLGLKYPLIEENLFEAGIIPLYEFRNIRKKYTKEGFIIDFDTAIFEDFIYQTCEIELIVDNENEIESAIKKIELFAKKHDIAIAHVEGRLIEYIRRKNPEHYQKLMKK